MGGGGGVLKICMWGVLKIRDEHGRQMRGSV